MNEKSSNSPLLSIVIPAYNVEEYILPAVQSALAQTFRDIEVIVVNDGSTDNTLGILEPLSDSRLRIITQKNRGLSAARNSGIKAARGKYIGLLDGDDIWFPEKAGKHVKALDSDPQLGISFSYSAYMDDDDREANQYWITKIKEPTLNDLVLRNHVGGSSPVIRKECFDQAGLFDESLRSCEDYEMWVRIMLKTDFTCKVIPEALTGYRIRSGSLTMNFEVFLDSAKSVMVIFENYLPHFPKSVKSKALAGIYRVTSRKALSDGQLDLARKYMNEALRICPTLIFTDIRAFGTFMVIYTQSILPKELRWIPYKVAQKLMSLFYRLFYRLFSHPLNHRQQGGLWEQSKSSH